MAEDVYSLIVCPPSSRRGIRRRHEPDFPASSRQRLFETTAFATKRGKSNRTQATRLQYTRYRLLEELVRGRWRRHFECMSDGEGQHRHIGVRFGIHSWGEGDLPTCNPEGIMLRQSFTALIQLFKHDGGAIIGHVDTFRQPVHAFIRAAVPWALDQIEVPSGFVVGEKIRNGLTGLPFGPSAPAAPRSPPTGKLAHTARMYRVPDSISRPFVLDPPSDDVPGRARDICEIFRCLTQISWNFLRLHPMQGVHEVLHALGEPPSPLFQPQLFDDLPGQAQIARLASVARARSFSRTRP